MNDLVFPSFLRGTPKKMHLMGNNLLLFVLFFLLFVFCVCVCVHDDEASIGAQNFTKFCLSALQQ